MGAREKLNGAHVLGAFGVAALIGALAGSWTAFFIAAAVLFGAAVYTEDTRAGKSWRR